VTIAEKVVIDAFQPGFGPALAEAGREGVRKQHQARRASFNGRADDAGQGAEPDLLVLVIHSPYRPRIRKHADIVAVVAVGHAAAVNLSCSSYG
jgi:hypothetical protein